MTYLLRVEKEDADTRPPNLRMSHGKDEYSREGMLDPHMRLKNKIKNPQKINVPCSVNNLLYLRKTI